MLKVPESVASGIRWPNHGVRFTCQDATAKSENPNVHIFKTRMPPPHLHLVMRWSRAACQGMTAHSCVIHICWQKFLQCLRILANMTKAEFPQTTTYSVIMCSHIHLLFCSCLNCFPLNTLDDEGLHSSWDLVHLDDRLPCAHANLRTDRNEAFE
jgi:hypothetical protein